MTRPSAVILPGVFTTRIASVPQESILLSVERWIVMSICEVISRSAEVSANCTSTPATAEQQVRSIKSTKLLKRSVDCTDCDCVHYRKRVTGGQFSYAHDYL